MLGDVLSSNYQIYTCILFFQTLPVTEMVQVSACGWLLSVLRAPSGTGIYSSVYNPHSAPTGGSEGVHGGVRSGNAHTIATSCTTLASNGLDDSLGELLLIVHQSNVEEVVAHIGIKQYAAKVRAVDQLRRLYSSWATVYYPEVPLLGAAPRGGKDGSLAVDSRTDRIESEDYGNDSMCAHLMQLLERKCLGKAQ